MRTPNSLHCFGAFASLAACVPHTALGAQQVDTFTALAALREAASACTADAGGLWGRPLCGPIALVDREGRLVIANDTVAGHHFLRLADAYITTLPASIYLANTSVEWGSHRWTLLMLPLPTDQYSRIALVMHEVFHREQAALGLAQPDALNNQLDQRQGRTWLRLEYRALAHALDALPNDTKSRYHIASALLFRAERRSIYPGSDSLENTLEIQEGLAEYTGERLAMSATGQGLSRVAQHVRAFEEHTPTFVRAFAYGTGPAIGVLLDHFQPTWRRNVLTHRDIGALLAQAVRFKVPRNVSTVARTRASEYGFADIDREEAARDSARAPAMRGYRARLVNGPTITLHQSRDSLSWTYDPTALVGYDLHSTIYPSGQFEAPWGKLVVDSGGVLVQNDFRWIRIGPVPDSLTPAAHNAGNIRRSGWMLTLNAGWTLAADPEKPGSYMVVLDRPKLRH
ncbi:MAG: hypothetical protein M3R65_10255 [Gemmatimonadota bacterium]|nr:hypothetical protein [Gemmatimonadota bacterium]